MPLHRRHARVEIVRHALGRQHRHRMRPQMRIERVAHGVGLASRAPDRHAPPGPRACTPASVRPAPCTGTRLAGRAPSTAAVSTPCTVDLIGLVSASRRTARRHIRWSACSAARLIHLKSDPSGGLPTTGRVNSEEPGHERRIQTADHRPAQRASDHDDRHQPRRRLAAGDHRRLCQ